MTEDWLGRWAEGRIGWHEKEGSVGLHEHWPDIAADSRVLVPLCGKTPDLIWLATRGCNVTGVEISPIACKAFFEEQNLAFEVDSSASLDCYRATDIGVRIFCGDYFEFQDDPFDAIFDRASLVAMPESMRQSYVSHTRSLLKPGAYQLLVTLEYDQSAAQGPPWALAEDEVRRHWPELERLSCRNDIDNSPPKFRNAGLKEFNEVLWSGRVGR